MTKFVNLTPHAIVIYRDGEPVLTIEASGQTARLVDASGPQRVSPIGDVPAVIYSPLDGRRLDGLPEPVSGTVYITSILCLPTARALGRYDVAAPDTDGGAVRVPRGEPGAGSLLGVTRLVYAGDEPPAYRLLTGSATYGTGTPRDIDVLGYGHAAAGEPLGVHCRIAYPAASLDLESDYWRGAIDYHEVTPTIGLDGAWEIRVPVWDDADPSRPTLLWHSPCARPVRVVRDVLRTGPAQLRRYAALGIMPTWDPQDTAPAHGEDSAALVAELSTDGVAPGYRGCGLMAWRRAAQRLTAAQLAALPAHVCEFLVTLTEVPETRLSQVAQRARVCTDALRREQEIADPQQRADAYGSPGASAVVTYFWHPAGYWTTPCGERRQYATFSDVLDVWAAAE